MTSSVLLYGIVVGGLLGAAAHCLDRALRSLRRGTRWVWMAALTLGFGAPFLPGILPASPRAPASSPAPLSLDDLYALAGTEHTLTAGGGFSLVALDRPLFLLWTLTTVALVLVLIWAGFWLHREKKGWKGKTLAGEDVFISGRLGPAVVGFLRPRIVLPQWTLTLDEEKLSLILLHEQEHRKARDPAVLAVGTLMTLACPLNPALWWMLRRLRLAVEGDCDARVLASGVHRKRYGRLLLDVAEKAGRGLNLAPALVEKRGTHLERRLDMIRQGGRNHRWISSALATVAALFFLALACETPTPPSPAEEEAGSAETYAAQEAAGDASAPSDGRFGPEQGSGSGDPAVGSATFNPVGGGLGEPSDRPLVVVDGVRMGTDMDVKGMVDAGDVARIEVVKGEAAEAAFGPDASGGVIKVFTKGRDTDGPSKIEAFEAQQAGTSTYTFDPAQPPSTLTPSGEARISFPEGSDAPNKVKLLVKEGNTVKAGKLGVVTGQGSPGTEPLVLIDGVPAEGPDWKNAITPDQIASVEVIKGAAAEAVYGPKGANGVILITLKK